MKQLLVALYLLVTMAQSAPDKLPPLLVTGDKLATTSQELTGNPVIIDKTSINRLPTGSGTYSDLLSTVAGAYPGNPTAGAFSLRGLNQDNVFGYVGTSSNSLVAVLEDGAPLSSQTLRFLPPPLWDLQGVEILRGPQSLSHGPNSLGGALLFHSTPPAFDFSGNALVEFSEYNTLRTGIAQNLTLIPDELAIRFSYLHQESDGQATNRFFNDDQYGATSRDRYQAQLLWKPAKNPDLAISLSLVHDRADGSPSPPPLLGRATRFSTVRSHSTHPPTTPSSTPPPRSMPALYCQMRWS